MRELVRESGRELVVRNVAGRESHDARAGVAPGGVALRQVARGRHRVAIPAAAGEEHDRPARRMSGDDPEAGRHLLFERGGERRAEPFDPDEPGGREIGEEPVRSAMAALSRWLKKALERSDRLGFAVRHLPPRRERRSHRPGSGRCGGSGGGRCRWWSDARPPVAATCRERGKKSDNSHGRPRPERHRYPILRRRSAPPLNQEIDERQEVFLGGPCLLCDGFEAGDSGRWD